MTDLLLIRVQNFMIMYITPPAIQNIGYKTYIIFAVLNASFLPVMVRISRPSCLDSQLTSHL